MGATSLNKKRPQLGIVKTSSWSPSSSFSYPVAYNTILRSGKPFGSGDEQTWTGTEHRDRRCHLFVIIDRAARLKL